MGRSRAPATQGRHSRALGVFPAREGFPRGSTCRLRVPTESGGTGTMNRVRVTAGLLVLVLETGCPVGGDAGVLHQALLRDEAEKMAQAGCPYADIEDACGPDPESIHACMDDCLEALARRKRK
jgi:hypothetical protein